jgi:rsbT co-antagonist protein RsbR
MSDPREELAKQVVGYLVEIFAGKCSITQESLQNTPDDPALGEIQAGLLFLHEELVARERERAAAMDELQTALAGLRSQHDALLRSKALTDELSTPIVKAGNGILMMPLIGTLDDARSTLVLERILSAIKEERARFVILDITGVPTIDQSSARYFVRFASATRLLGARAMLAGIRPAVAQSLATLNVDLAGLVAVRNLEEALRICSEKSSPASR